MSFQKLFLSAAVCLALTASPPEPAGADVLERDHVRLRVDYLELRTAQPVDVIMLADGIEAWRSRLPSQTLHLNLGPVVAPPGTSFQVTVAKPDGTVIGSAAITDSGANGSNTVRQGEVTKLIVSTQGVPVWSIPDVPIAPARSLDDRARKKLTAALVELNRAIVEASDGQIRVEQFTVSAKRSAESAMPGTIRIGKCGGDCAATEGTLAKPAAAQVATAEPTTLLRAFERAYLGVPADVRCWSRGDSPETAREERFDCREHVSAQLHTLGVRLLPGGFPGPEPARAASVQFSDEETVDFSEGGGSGLGDDTINEVIAGHGEALATCLRKSGLAKARIKFSIRGQDGRVAWVRVNERRDGGAHHCVDAVMTKMRFPKSKAARTVAVFEMSR